MTLTVEENVLTTPVDITVGRSGAIVAAKTSKTDLLQQAGFTVCEWLRRTPLGYLLGKP